NFLSSKKTQYVEEFRSLVSISSGGIARALPRILRSVAPAPALNSLHPTLYAFPPLEFLFFRCPQFFHADFHRPPCASSNASVIDARSPLRLRRKTETRRTPKRRKN